jgi:hypothetical protein
MQGSLPAQTSERIIRWLLPTLQDVVFISLFILAMMIGPRMLNIDGDLGRHITIGRQIIATRSIPLSDIFSHTMAGEPLTPHEWLAQTIFAAWHSLAGLDGVVFWCALLIALTFTLVFRTCLNHQCSLLVALLVTYLGAAAASLHWLARPHLYTMLLVAVWVMLFERLRAGQRVAWWVFPLSMLVWVNLHGAFIAGLVVWAAYFAGSLLDAGLLKRHWRSLATILPDHRHFLLIGVSSLVVTLANPAGLHIWDTTFGFLRNRYLVGHTAEYLPPNFHDVSTWPFLLMLGLSLLLLGFLRPSLPGALVLSLAGWSLMGLYSTRNIPLYAIAVAPVFAVSLGGWLGGLAAGRIQRFESQLESVNRQLKATVPVLLLLLVGLVWLMLGRLAAPQEGANRFLPEVFPVQAVDWLVENPVQGEMFNHFPWGGYLLYRLWPERQVFIDGQTDFYGEALTRQYETVITLSEGWEQVLDQTRVVWVIVPAEARLARQLHADPHWRLLYQDETAVILQRTD